MMKSVALALGSLVLLATFLTPCVLGQLAGGWAKASVKEKPVLDAAQFAVKAQQEELKKTGKEVKLVLEKIVSAEQQVVQGMNYKLTLQVKIGDKAQTAEAKVWARVWLKPEEQYQLTGWKIATDQSEDTKAKP